MMPRRLLPLLLCLAGCATVSSAPQATFRPVASGVGPLLLRISGDDPRVRDQVTLAVARAAPYLSRWGQLRDPVRVEIVPTHDDLETTVGRPGYAWLRAWAQYDRIVVQAPSTWDAPGPTQARLDTLIRHELTHCLLFQQSSDAEHWTHKGIPLWFREGMASVTAHQEQRWYSREELAQFEQTHPQLDLMGDAERLSRSQLHPVYSAAHHAFAFLVARYGEPRVRSLLARMRQGASFNQAFAEEIGIPVRRFLRDFDHYLRWRGWGELALP